jgi:hypothetical protein
MTLLRVLPACLLLCACARDVAPAQQGAPRAEAAANPAKASASASDEQARECIYVEGEQGHDEPACPHGSDATVATEDTPGHYGAPFAHDGSPLALSELLAAQAEPDDASVLVRGKVEAVCQTKGCWLVLADQGQSARVLMKGHSFSVPTDSRGQAAVVEGTLSTRTFTEAQVKHLEEDRGGDPDAVSGERTEYILTATGIRIDRTS